MIFTDIPLTGYISTICIKLLQHVLLIFTSIPQLRLLMVHHAFLMSKLLGCFPCSYSKKRILWQSILVKECLDLKFFYTFHLSPIGKLVGYNEKFQPQKVVVEVLKEVIGDFSCAWIFLGFYFHWNNFVFCMQFIVFICR